MDIVINNATGEGNTVKKKSKYKIINAVVVAVVFFLFALGLVSYKVLQKQNNTISSKTIEALYIQSNQCDYILNTNTKKAHKPNCKYVDNIDNENRKDYHGTDEELQDKGYSPCKYCQAR